MILSDLSVKRPVFATVINLLIVTFGVVAFMLLPLREYPDIDPPIVNISTSYPGAAAAIVETKITQVLEDRISGVEGVKHITSNSRVGRSSITIEFDLNRDIDAATNDVRDRISRALRSLPEQADPPQVFKANDDENVIVWFVLQSNTMSTLQLTDYAQRYIVDRFAVVEPGKDRFVFPQRHSILIRRAVAFFPFIPLVIVVEIGIRLAGVVLPIVI